MNPLLVLVPKKLFGMPPRPLIVHRAVVLIRLAALALIAVGWNAAWRRRYYLPITLIAVAGAGAAFFAAQSGESLQLSPEQAGWRAGDHSEYGDVAFLASLVLAIACLVLYAYNEFGDRVRERMGWMQRWRLPVDEQTALYGVRRNSGAGARCHGCRRPLRSAPGVDERTLAGYPFPDPDLRRPAPGPRIGSVPYRRRDGSAQSGNERGPNAAIGSRSTPPACAGSPVARRGRGRPVTPASSQLRHLGRRPAAP